MSIQAHKDIVEDDVMSRDRIIEMIRQIEDFFKPYPEKRRIEGMRNHLRTYWDPRMREQLIHMSKGGKYLFSPAIISTINLLKDEQTKSSYYGPPKI